MKFGLQNCAIIPTENSCIKFNNNKTNTLQRYGIAQNYIILHKMVQLLSQHSFKISNHTDIQKLRQRD